MHVSLHVRQLSGERFGSALWFGVGLVDSLWGVQGGEEVRNVSAGVWVQTTEVWL